MRRTEFVCDCPCSCGMPVDAEGAECSRCAAGDHPGDRLPGEPCDRCEVHLVPAQDDVPAWLRGLWRLWHRCVPCLAEEAHAWRWDWVEGIEETDAALVAAMAIEREELEAEHGPRP